MKKGAGAPLEEPRRIASAGSVDLVEYSAVGKVFLLGFVPSSEDVFKIEEFNFWKIGGVLRRDSFVDGAVEVLGRIVWPSGL